MHLVAALQPAQDRNGVVGGRLIDRDRLKAPCQRGVFFDIAAVLVGGGRADAAQLTARQGRLQHVRGVDAAIDPAGADQHVQFVDKDDIAPRGGLDLGQHRLQPLFELAAELGAGQDQRQVEREHAAVLQPLGHVAGGETLRQTLDDGGFPHSGFADQHRVVLGASREHLDRAADLVIAANDRIELTLTGLLGQVAGIFFQRVPSSARPTAHRRCGPGAFC